MKALMFYSTVDPEQLHTGDLEVGGFLPITDKVKWLKPELHGNDE